MVHLRAPAPVILTSVDELLEALETPDLPVIEYPVSGGTVEVLLDTGFGAGAIVRLPCTVDEAFAAIAQSVLEVWR